LLLDYLAQGIEIEGVDNSPEMLDLCHEKAEGLGLRPTLYLGEMQRLDLPRKYRTIIVPSSSFQLILEPGDASEAMRRFFAHLEPGGTLVIPFMILWSGDTSEPIVRQEEWKRSGEAVRPEDGLTVRRWSRSTYDIPRQLESTEDRYELLRDGEVIYTEEHSRSPGVRWYNQQQAADLYRAADFTGIRLTREFTHEPASEEDNLFSVFGMRP
jgi:hypothetical protein